MFASNVCVRRRTKAAAACYLCSSFSTSSWARSSRKRSSWHTCPSTSGRLVCWVCRYVGQWVHHVVWLVWGNAEFDVFGVPQTCCISVWSEYTGKNRGWSVVWFVCCPLCSLLLSRLEYRLLQITLTFVHSQSIPTHSAHYLCRPWVKCAYLFQCARWAPSLSAPNCSMSWPGAWIGSTKHILRPWYCHLGEQ